jgi:hypothetical protein
MHDPDRPDPRRDLDEVSQASLDSFPASDPPSWPGLRLGPPAPNPHRDKANLDQARSAPPPTRNDEQRPERNR